MKVYFCFVLAFAVFLLAVSAKDKDASKEEPKIVPKPRNPENKKESPVNSDEGDKATSSLPTSSENSTKTQISDQERCGELIGKFVNDTFVGTKVEYDLRKLLEKYGGAPGKVNTTWTEKEDAPVDKEKLEERPLPDADEEYWIYKYGYNVASSNDLKALTKIYKFAAGRTVVSLAVCKMFTFKDSEIAKSGNTVANRLYV